MSTNFGMSTHVGPPWPLTASSKTYKNLWFLQGLARSHAFLRFYIKMLKKTEGFLCIGHPRDSRNGCHLGPTWDHFGIIFLSFWATSPTHSSTRQPTQPSTNETFNQPSLQTTKPSTNQVFNQPSLQPTKPSTNQPFNQPSLQPTKSSISFARLLPIIESSLGLGGIREA